MQGPFVPLVSFHFDLFSSSYVVLSSGLVASINGPPPLFIPIIVALVTLMATHSDSSQGTLIMLGCNLITILLVSYWVKTHYNGPNTILKNPLEIHISNVF
jgi:hypothetical protein